MSKALEIEFCFSDNSNKIQIGMTKRVNVIFSNSSLYDMQLFCSVSLPFGLSVSKNEFDIICPATGKTYFELDITLNADSKLFYDSYSPLVNIYDTVSGSGENFSFDLLLHFDSALDSLVFSRTYVLETSKEYNVKISALPSAVSRILLNGLEIEFTANKDFITFQNVFNQGLNELNVQFSSPYKTSPSIEFLMPDGNKASLPFFISNLPTLS